MAIDPLVERLVSLAQAAAMFPNRPSISALYRWTSTGFRGIRLEWVQSGNKRVTSREAVARFIAATTLAANGNSPPTLHGDARNLKAERAGQSLDAEVFGSRKPLSRNRASKGRQPWSPDPTSSISKARATSANCEDDASQKGGAFFRE